MKVSIICDDDIHKKIKVISVLKEQTLNTLTVNLYKKLINAWEAEHGEIKIP